MPPALALALPEPLSLTEKNNIIFKQNIAYFLARLNAPTPTNESLPDGHSDDPANAIAGSTANASSAYPVLRNFNNEQDIEDDDSPVDVVVVENGGFKCYKPLLVPRDEEDGEDEGDEDGESPGTGLNSSESTRNANQHTSDGRYLSPSKKAVESVKTLDTDLEMNDLSLPGLHSHHHHGDHGPQGKKARRKERWLRYLGWDHVRKFSSLSAEEKHMEAEYWKERW